MKCQIGSDEHRHIYSPTNMEVNSVPVYKCRRGGTREGSEDVFWLAQGEDGRWIAREYHMGMVYEADPVRQGINFLQTMNPIDDITNPGDIDWMWYNAQKEEWMFYDATWEYRYTTIHIDLSEPSLHQNQIDVGASTITSAQASTITSAHVSGRTILSAPAIKLTKKMERQWRQLVFGVFQLGRHRDLMNRQWRQLVFGVLQLSRDKDLS